MGEKQQKEKTTSKKNGEDITKVKEGKAGKDYEKERIIENKRKEEENYGTNKSKERLKKYEKD